MSFQQTEGQYQTALSKSIKYLNYRSRSCQEIREYLCGKKYNSKVIDQVINRLKELQLIDDEKFAEEYIREKVYNSTNPIGPLKAKYDLSKKGINEQIIDKILTSISNEKEIDLAKQVVEKKYPCIKDADFNKRQKAAVYLERRGYSYDAIYTILDLY